MSVRCIADNLRKEVYLSGEYGNSLSAWRLRLSLLVCQADNKVGRKPADYPVPEATLLASEGRYEDLPVFCTEEMARMLEERLEHDHELLPGLWRVYRLEGVWEEDVVEVRPGEWRMRRPAQLIALSAS